jgi:hypothetical protein
MQLDLTIDYQIPLCQLGQYFIVILNPGVIIPWVVAFRMEL